MNNKKKQKRLSNADFNAIYQLIRDGAKHPEVKVRTGQVNSLKDWREY